MRYIGLILILIIINTVESQSIALPDAPALRGDGTLRRLRVPILMYHYVDELPPNADDIRIGLTLHPTYFQQHLQYLSNEGYVTISLYEMDAALMSGAVLPSKPVILTFDDGYDDHYSNVFPMLQEYGFTGTFFIISEFVDNHAVGYLNWQQIREMADAGISMEAHTKTHPDLRGRNDDFLIYQIMGSVESIAAHTGISPQMFAYPVGRYDADTLRVLRTTPIIRAVTTQLGVYHTSTNALELARMRVTNETGVGGLAYLLNYPN